MCGIISVKNLRDNRPVNGIVRILYENQRERGQLGFGFVGLNARRIDTYRATDEKGILKYLDGNEYDEIIFHHRLPTSTENTLKSTHPFVVAMDDRRYYFVHNGVIQNAYDLKEKHEKLGIKYSSEEGNSFNDSEALAWDFCLWLNGRQGKIDARGSVAFVCLEVDTKTNRAERLYFYRNSAARLKVYRDSSLLVIASQGNYAPVPENQLCFWDYRKGQISRYRALDIPVPEFAGLNGYGYDYFDDGMDDTYGVSATKADIAALEQERDYLVSIGECEKAEALDDEIEELEDELKELRGMSLT
jgi:hypothetical protein